MIEFHLYLAPETEYSDKNNSHLYSKGKVSAGLKGVDKQCHFFARLVVVLTTSASSHHTHFIARISVASSNSSALY